MIEIIALIVAAGGLGTRAQQRRLDKVAVVTAAVVGWLVFLGLGASGLGPAALFLRWMWVGAVYLYIEMAHGGKKAGDTWKCPECTLYNDPGTLVCLCGYENPETS